MIRAAPTCTDATQTHNAYREEGYRTLADAEKAMQEMDTHAQVGYKSVEKFHEFTFHTLMFFSVAQHALRVSYKFSQKHICFVSFPVDFYADATGHEPDIVRTRGNPLLGFCNSLHPRKFPWYVNPIRKLVTSIAEL